ncbi:MAG: S9 family peptidase [Bryobacterales bacterium]|nr:S9 family peptidase [Bryobacterales bacterium]
MLLLRLAVLSCLCALGLAGAPQPVSHESIWLMKRVGAPVPSPDGRWVVFLVTEPAYDDKDQVADLWILPADGSSAPRRLTSTKSAESGAAWSPDSRRLAFSARRENDEVSQIYVLDLAGGGEAVRVTSLSTGAESPKWSPDGQTLAFSSAVYPGAADDEANRKIAAERKARKYTARVYDGFPIRYWDKWNDDLKPHLFIQAAQPGAKARDLLAGTRLAGEAGFAGTETTSGQELVAAWAPDGQSIVFAATVNKNAAAYAWVVTQLYQVPAAGGEPKQLTSGPDSHARPVFSPDGAALFSITSPNDGQVYHLDRLARFAWPSMQGRSVITAALDRSVNSFALTPDSRMVYLTAEEHGHEKIFAVPAGGGSSQLAVEMSRGVYTGLAIPSKASAPVLFAGYESANEPPEVVRIDPAGKSHQRLTNFSVAAAAGIDWQPPRHFWFTSSRGKQIHNMIVLPPGFDEKKKYPLFVLIHGGAANMWRDAFVLRWNYHLLAAPGFVVLLTNYTGSTGFGEKFSQEIQLDPLRGPGAEINEAADEAIRRFPFIDGARQAAGGASYGGHLANWLQASTTRYKCLVAHAGLINLESQWGTSDTIYHRELTSGGPVWEQGAVWREQNPIRYAAQFRTPILLTVGERDYRVPLNQTLENWSVLQRLRIPSRLIVFPDENHWVLKGENSRFFYQEVQDWLKKYLLE